MLVEEGGGEEGKGEVRRCDLRDEGETTRKRNALERRHAPLLLVAGGHAGRRRRYRRPLGLQRPQYCRPTFGHCVP